MKPDLSIILPVYNGEKYLEESLKSILHQTHKNFECIIAFNGTIDSSKEIVNKYTADTRISIVDYGLEAGKAKTLNKVLKICNSDWIAIQDDDDVWLPKKIESQLNYINDYDVIGSNCQYINEKGDFIGMPTISCDHNGIIQQSLNGVNQIINTSAIFKKTNAININGWDENLDGIEDYDFWLKQIKLGCKFINISKPLILHRLHNQSNFNTKKYDLENLLKKYR